jgi:serine protease Do
MPSNSNLSRHIRSLALGGAAMATVTLALAASWSTQNASASPAAAVATLLPGGSFADIVASDKPAVVTVTTKMTAQVSDGQGDGMPQFGQNEPFDEFFRQFFGQNFPGGQMPRQRQMPGQNNGGGRPVAEALGSGFIIAADGTIVTNNHVIDGASEIKVTLDDGSEHKATLLGRDAKSDLAVLKIEAGKPLPTVAWGDSDALRPGDPILAIGNPFGIGTTVTSGIVSARGRDLHNGPYDDFIQVDAAINHGNSGGPLVNTEGKVVGINTAIYSPNGGNVGVGFAIPSDQAQAVVAKLISQGSIEHGYIGVQIQTVTPDVADAIGLTGAAGALVAHVEDASPAKKAGLKAGDVIVSFDGHAVKTPKDLSRIVADISPGTGDKVTVWRKGKSLDLSITVGKNGEEEKVAVASGKPSHQQADGQKVPSLGLELSDITPEARQAYNVPEDDTGAVVAGVMPDKAAAGSGIEQGDVILAVNQEKMSSASDVLKAVDSAVKAGRKSILLQIERAGTQSFVAVPLGNA